VQAGIEMAALLRITPLPALLENMLRRNLRYRARNVRAITRLAIVGVRSGMAMALPAQNDSLAAIRQRPAGRQSD
jgi:hypothetical protein